MLSSSQAMLYSRPLGKLRSTRTTQMLQAKWQWSRAKSAARRRPSVQLERAPRKNAVHTQRSTSSHTHHTHTQPERNQTEISSHRLADRFFLQPPLSSPGVLLYVLLVAKPVFVQFFFGIYSAVAITAASGRSSKVIEKCIKKTAQSPIALLHTRICGKYVSHDHKNSLYSMLLNVIGRN